MQNKKDQTGNFLTGFFGLNKPKKTKKSGLFKNLSKRNQDLINAKKEAGW
jgi:hypothetical protein